MTHNFPAELPELGLKIISGWIPVLLEPVPEVSDGGIILLDTGFDANTAPGIAWVLGVPKDFTYLRPKDAGVKAPGKDDYTFVYEPEVERGDRIIFQRYVRSSAKALGSPLSEEVMADYPGYEALFIHHESIVAKIVED